MTGVSDRDRAISSTTLQECKATFGCFEVSDAGRVKALRNEDAKLKELVAEQTADGGIQKDDA